MQTTTQNLLNEFAAHLHFKDFPTVLCCIMIISRCGFYCCFCCKYISILLRDYNVCTHILIQQRRCDDDDDVGTTLCRRKGNLGNLFYICWFWHFCFVFSHSFSSSSSYCEMYYCFILGKDNNFVWIHRWLNLLFLVSNVKFRSIKLCI